MKRHIAGVSLEENVDLCREKLISEYVYNLRLLPQMSDTYHLQKTG